jgi:hypothetical protein
MGDACLFGTTWLAFYSGGLVLQASVRDTVAMKGPKAEGVSFHRVFAHEAYDVDSLRKLKIERSRTDTFSLERKFGDDLIQFLLNKKSVNIVNSTAPNELDSMDDILYTPTNEKLAIAHIKTLSAGVIREDHDDFGCEEDLSYSEINRKYLAGRRCFISNAGLLGLGPEEIAPGDAICSVLGLSTPVVVRGAGPGLWRLVGECYIHGLTNGLASREGPLFGDLWIV